MQALTVLPLRPGSLALTEVEEPAPSDGDVLVQVLEVGVCGTDLEIVAGEYGQAPPGRDRLVLGHESLGRVLEAPDGCGVAPGDLVVGIVRRPDPQPCANCAEGRWDMCLNDGYTEHGIKGLDGFMRERYRTEPQRLVRIDPALAGAGVLTEPASVVAKAWAEVDRFSTRTAARPRVALVTGAGPVGLLAALLAVQRGLDVHVLDIVTDGVKPQLVRDLGATYHCVPLEEVDIRPDVVIECTGVSQVVHAAMARTGPNGITCLTGVSTPGRTRPVDLGGLNRSLVLENDIVFGTVNASRAHYEAGVEALARADRDWLERLITRRVPLADHRQALDRGRDDVKVVLEMVGRS